jgi:hypothetical protein
MSNVSGITDLPLYQIWQIADHIMVNEPNGFPITEWQKANRKTIMYLNDLVFYHDFSTEEMSKLVGGLYLKKNIRSPLYVLRSFNIMNIFSKHDKGGLLNSIISNINGMVNGSSTKTLHVYGLVCIL